MMNFNNRLLELLEEKAVCVKNGLIVVEGSSVTFIADRCVEYFRKMPEECIGTSIDFTRIKMFGKWYELVKQDSKQV